MKHKGTLLIFAYECYPYNRTGSTIGAQRPYQFAKHLSEAGWRVIVLCCDKEQRRTLRKSELAKETTRILQHYKLEQQHEACTIIPLPSLTYYGFGDWIWSRSVKEGPGNTYIAKGFPYNLFRKAATIYNQLMHGDYSWSWVPVADQFAQLLIEQQPVHIVLGEHGPDAGIILADRFSRRHHLPWIADFRDPALRFLTGYFAKLYKGVVRRIVNSASGTITVSKYWSGLDEELYKKKSHVVLNGYDQELFSATDAHVFSAFTVSYFGSFDQTYQDILPSLESFLHFLKQNDYASNIQLFYRGLAYKEFIRHCKEIGIPSSHLNVQDFCDREETVAYMKGSQVLLIYSVSLDKTTNIYEKQGVYPGKVFEYIGANQPILLIPSDHSILAALINEEDRGLATTSVQEAVEFFQEKYKSWSTHDSQPKVRHNNEVYSRKYQAIQLDRILSDTLGNVPQ